MLNNRKCFSNHVIRMYHISLFVCLFVFFISPTPSEYSPERGHKVVLDRVIWMWHPESVYSPFITTILHNLPAIQVFYKNKEEDCERNHVSAKLYFRKVKFSMPPKLLQSLLTFSSWILEEISSLLAQEIKQPPVLGRFGSITEEISLPSTPFSPQRFTISHFFPLMAY